MSSATPSGPTPPGATSVGAPRRKRGGLLLAIAAAIVAVLLLLLLLSRCGNGDDDQSGAAGSSSSAASSSAASSSAGTSSAAGSSASPSGASPAVGQPSSVVAADGTAVLDPAAPADPTAVLGRVSGQTVTGTAVQVLSVPADEGFWIGSTDTQRVWVQLTGAVGESPYQVRQGDRVDFTGTVVAHDAGFPATVGLGDATGAAQLAAQGQHVEVDRSALTLSS